MDGWVGHVGWPIADVWPTKWSSVQLAIWRRTGKVRRSKTSILPLCYAANNRSSLRHIIFTKKVATAKAFVTPEGFPNFPCNNIVYYQIMVWMGMANDMNPTDWGGRRKATSWFQSWRRRTLLLSLIHISEPTRLGMISYAVFCLKKKQFSGAPTLVNF